MVQKPGLMQKKIICELKHEHWTSTPINTFTLPCVAASPCWPHATHTFLGHDRYILRRCPKNQPADILNVPRSKMTFQLYGNEKQLQAAFATTTTAKKTKLTVNPPSETPRKVACLGLPYSSTTGLVGVFLPPSLSQLGTPSARKDAQLHPTMTPEPTNPFQQSPPLDPQATAVIRSSATKGALLSHPRAPHGPPRVMNKQSSAPQCPFRLTRRTPGAEKRSR